MTDKLNVLILAGEMSGDLHAARLLRSLKTQVPEVTAWGFGGDALAAEGMEVIEHTRDLSVMGLVEVLKHYGYFRRIFDALETRVRRAPPDLILLIDYPGFNLRFAKAVRDLGVPTVQYICPQVWAWKQSRIPKMAKILDQLICIFPFEPPLFEGTGLDAGYFGHPMVEETLKVQADSGWGGGPRLALLPGSRVQEVQRLFPPMAEAALRLKKDRPDLQIRVAAATEALADLMRTLPGGNEVELVVGKTRALVKGADAALVTSGTATLETALLGTPMLVVYKTSAMTYAIGKRLVKVKHIGMVNLIAEREICREYIQHAAAPEALAEGIKPLLEDSDPRRKMLAGLAEVRERLVSDEGGLAPVRAILARLSG
jgi:lipid-A-disaccharide synthase